MNFAPLRYVARIALETDSPLAITTGRGDEVYDTQLVRDANGLPAIPGSSLAGVLRSLTRRVKGPDKTNDIFGCGERNNESPSRLSVSWGCLHDSSDCPVDSLLVTAKERKRLSSDAILRLAGSAETPHRDRVRLNHLGAADAENKGLYDVRFLPPGNRFTVELVLKDEKEDSEDWDFLLGLFFHPAFRLGGNSRSGFGSMKPVRVKQAVFRLDTPEGFEGYGNLGADLSETGGLADWSFTPTVSSQPVLTLALRPNDFWRFGQGDEPVGQYEKKIPDMLPQNEVMVTWKGREGTVEKENHVLVPASAVKGALRHRTVFHYNVLSKNFIDDETGDPRVLAEEGDRAVGALFGSIKSDSDEKGEAGQLLFADVFLKEKPTVTEMPHTSIDRFTGGVRSGALFSEELLWKGEWHMDVIVIPCKEAPPSIVRKAFGRALDDLVEGRLSLGGGGSRGHGVFAGEIVWSDGGDWIEAGEEVSQ